MVKGERGIGDETEPKKRGEYVPCGTAASCRRPCRGRSRCRCCLKPGDGARQHAHFPTKIPKFRSEEVWVCGARHARSSALTGFSTKGLDILVVPTRTASSVSSNASSVVAQGAREGTQPSRSTTQCRGTGMPCSSSVLYTCRRSSSRCCAARSLIRNVGLGKQGKQGVGGEIRNKLQGVLRSHALHERHVRLRLLQREAVGKEG